MYQPFWCEENIWQLTLDPTLGSGERHVVLISGITGHVACWQQRAAAVGEPVLWDYHVVLAVRQDGWTIWDLDTRLACPLAAMTWLDHTFPCLVGLPPVFSPRFLVVPAAGYRRDLFSDRQHMRTATGDWQHPPPPWPAPCTGSVTLADYLRQTRNGLTMSELNALFDRW